MSGENQIGCLGPVHLTVCIEPRKLLNIILFRKLGFLGTRAKDSGNTLGVVACDDLNDNGSPRLLFEYLIYSWMKRLEKIRRCGLKQMCHWGWVLRLQKSTPFQVSSFSLPHAFESDVLLSYKYTPMPSARMNCPSLIGHSVLS